MFALTLHVICILLLYILGLDMVFRVELQRICHTFCQLLDFSRPLFVLSAERDYLYINILFLNQSSFYIYDTCKFLRSLLYFIRRAEIVWLILHTVQVSADRGLILLPRSYPFDKKVLFS